MVSNNKDNRSKTTKTRHKGQKGVSLLLNDIETKFPNTVKAYLT